MKKIRIILICLAVALSTPLTTNAQDYELFEFKSQQVSIGYGFESATRWINTYQIKNSDGYSYGVNNSWGAINIKYLYRFSDYITFGMSYTHASMKLDIIKDGGSVGQSNIGIHIALPEFKSDWYKKGIVTVYSRVAVGLAISTIKDKFPSSSTNKIELDVAFQVSPIGIELGNTIAFYIEGGFGQQGLVITGFRINF